MNITLWRCIDLLNKAWLHYYKGSSAKPRLTFLIEPAGISSVFSIKITLNNERRRNIYIKQARLTRKLYIYIYKIAEEKKIYLQVFAYN
jgi:hypothetical protein